MKNWKNLSFSNIEEFLNVLDQFLYSIYRTSIVSATEVQLSRVLKIIKSL
ncbi:hypothetical protein LCGC14_1740080 [marine sediment metagenome]|uniref:Uncharacterized protein n=1 Tax=marine sediment metagenome TaxID=412755 RepID=A0A0F9K6N3_9ZZZZ